MLHRKFIAGVVEPCTGSTCAPTLRRVPPKKYANIYIHISRYTVRGYLGPKHNIKTHVWTYCWRSALRGVFAKAVGCHLTCVCCNSHVCFGTACFGIVCSVLGQQAPPLINASLKGHVKLQLFLRGGYEAENISWLIQFIYVNWAWGAPFQPLPPSKTNLQNENS